LGDNGFHSYLDAASVQRHGNQMGVFHSPFSARKDKMGVLVNFPKLFKET
jgi:hypothetical protein